MNKITQFGFNFVGFLLLPLLILGFKATLVACHCGLTFDFILTLFPGTLNRHAHRKRWRTTTAKHFVAKIVHTNVNDACYLWKFHLYYIKCLVHFLRSSHFNTSLSLEWKFTSFSISLALALQLGAPCVCVWVSALNTTERHFNLLSKIKCAQVKQVYFEHLYTEKMCI